MSDPWAAFPTTKPSAPSAPSVAPAADPWASFPTEKPESKAYTGKLLPFSVDEQGRGKLDFDAGIIGGLKRAFTTPGDVMAGKVDLNTDEGLGRALEMATVASPIPAPMRSGEFIIPGAKAGLKEAKVAAPTAEALKEAASTGYNQVREMAVDYATPAVTDMIGGVRMALEKDGIIGELAPKTHAIIQKFANPPEGSVVSLSGLEAARRAAQHAAKDFTNPTEQLAATRLIEGIDQFVSAGNPRGVVAGPAAEAAEALATARANSAASKRSESLTGIEERADLKSAAANSGANLDNTIRQRVADLVLNPKKSRGFTPEELALLEHVVLGDNVRNGLRTVSNLLGGGGGLGALASGGVGAAAGAGLGGPVGAAIGSAVGPTVGGLAKWVQNALGRRALANADEATRMRSPLYEQTRAATPRVEMTYPATESLARGGAVSAIGAPGRADADLQRRLIELLREGGA